MVPPLLDKILQAPCNEHGVAQVDFRRLGKNKFSVMSRIARELANEEPTIRRAAAQALGCLPQNAGIVISQLSAAIDDVDSGVRLAAINAVGSMGKEAESTASRLIRRLADHDSSIRDAATRSLAVVAPDWRGGRQLQTEVKYFLELLGSDRPETRVAAAQILGESGERTAIQNLMELLLDDDETVRSVAVSSLSEIEPEWRSTKESQSWVEGWIGRLARQNSAVKHYVARAMGVLGEWGRPAVRDLVRLSADLDPAVREASRNSLWKIDSDWQNSELARSVRPELLILMTAGDSRVRSAARHLLLEIDQDWAQSSEAKNSVPRLSEVVRRNGPTLARREAAANVIHEIDPLWHESQEAKLIVKDILAEIESGDSGLIKEAFTLLSAVDNGWKARPEVRQAVQRLIHQLVNEKTKEVRIRLIHTLHGLDVNWHNSSVVSRFVSDLIDETTDLNGNVRSAAKTLLSLIDSDWPSRPEAKRAIQQLLDQLLRGGSLGVRVAAAELLGAIRSRDAIPELLRARISPERVVRDAATSALFCIVEATASVGDLIELLVSEQVEVRSSAQDLLRKISPNWMTDEAGALAVPHFCDRLARGSEEAKVAAATLLGQIASPSSNVVSSLVLSAADEFQGVRKASLESLELIDKGWAQSEKVMLVFSDLLMLLIEGNGEVRVAAEHILAKIDPKWPQHEESLLAAPHIADRMDNGSVQEKIASAEILAKIGSAEVIRNLVISAAHESVDVRTACLEALSKIDPKWPQHEESLLAAPHIADRMDNGSAPERIASAEILAKIGSAEAIRNLVISAGHESVDVRTACLEALSKIDPKWPQHEESLLAAPHIADRMGNGSVQEKIASAEILATLGCRATISELVVLTADRNDDVRLACRNALGKIDPNWSVSESAVSTIPRLLESLAAADAEVRSLAETLLSEIDSSWRMRPETQAEVLRFDKQLTSQDVQTQTLAAFAVGAIRPRSSIPKLIFAAVFGSGGAYDAAMNALHSIDRQWPLTEEAAESIPQLVDVLSSEVWYHRSRAAQVLGMIGVRAQVAIPALILCSTNLSDRPFALAALNQIDADWADSPSIAASVTGLVEMLRSPDPLLQHAAADVLAMLSSNASEAAQELRNKLSSQVVEVAGAAKTALGRVDRQPFVIQVLALARDWPGRVRGFFETDPFTESRHIFEQLRHRLAQLIAWGYKGKSLPEDMGTLIETYASYARKSERHRLSMLRKLEGVSNTREWAQIVAAIYSEMRLDECRISCYFLVRQIEDPTVSIDYIETLDRTLTGFADFVIENEAFISTFALQRLSKLKDIETVRRESVPIPMSPQEEEAFRRDIEAFHHDLTAGQQAQARYPSRPTRGVEWIEVDRPNSRGLACDILRRRTRVAEQFRPNSPPP